MQDLAAKLKTLMDWQPGKRRGRLTLRQVAKGTGLSHSYLWMLLSGARTNPTADALQRLADFFGTDVSYFLDRPQAGQPAEYRGRLKRIQDLVERAEADGPRGMEKELAQAWELVREAGPAGLAVRVGLLFTKLLTEKKELARSEAVLRELRARWEAKMTLDQELLTQFRWANLAHDQCRYFEAIERMETCLERVDATGHETPLLQNVWYNLGIFYGRVGRSEDAVRAYARALELKSPDAQQDIAFIHMGLGLAHQNAGRPEVAIEHLERSLAILTDLGDARWAAAACNNLGDVLWSLGRWAEARARYEAGLLAARMAGDEKGVAVNLSGITCCQLELGDPQKAMATINQSLEQLAHLDEPAERAIALLVRSRVHAALRRWDDATKDLEESRAFFYEHRMVYQLMRAVAVETEINGWRGTLEQGAEQLLSSAELFRRLSRSASIAHKVA